MSSLTAIVEKKKGKGAIVRLLSFECAKRAVRSKACGIEAMHSKRVVMRRDAYHSFQHSFQHALKNVTNSFSFSTRRLLTGRP
jgi:hypothetical protein